MCKVKREWGKGTPKKSNRFGSLGVEELADGAKEGLAVEIDARLRPQHPAHLGRVWGEQLLE